MHLLKLKIHAPVGPAFPLHSVCQREALMSTHREASTGTLELRVGLHTADHRVRWIPRVDTEISTRHTAAFKEQATGK